MTRERLTGKKKSSLPIFENFCSRIFGTVAKPHHPIHKPSFAKESNFHQYFDYFYDCFQLVKGRITGILLLFCLVAPIVVTFTFLHYQKRQVRKEVKHQIIAGIDKTELVLLKFTKQETQTKLRWKHSKEFEYKDQMYDIVEKEIKGDTIYYWCWWDNKETKLNKQLDELLAYAWGKDPKQKENRKNLTSFYKSLYFEQPTDYHPFSLQTKQITTDYKFSYRTVSYPPPVPPPEIS